MSWTKHIFGNVCERMFENMVCSACSLCSGMFACSWHILVRASQIWHWLNICSYVRLNACSLHNSKRHVRNTPNIYIYIIYIYTKSTVSRKPDATFPQKVPFRVSQIPLFPQNTERHTRRHANNSPNLPTSRAKRTQGRNNPVQGSTASLR